MFPSSQVPLSFQWVPRSSGLTSFSTSSSAVLGMALSDCYKLLVIAGGEFNLKHIFQTTRAVFVLEVFSLVKLKNTFLIKPKNLTCVSLSKFVLERCILFASSLPTKSLWAHHCFLRLEGGKHPLLVLLRHREQQPANAILRNSPRLVTQR